MKSRKFSFMYLLEIILGGLPALKFLITISSSALNLSGYSSQLAEYGFNNSWINRWGPIFWVSIGSLGAIGVLASICFDIFQLKRLQVLRWFLAIIFAFNLFAWSFLLFLLSQLEGSDAYLFLSLFGETIVFLYYLWILVFNVKEPPRQTHIFFLIRVVGQIWVALVLAQWLRWVLFNKDMLQNLMLLYTRYPSKFLPGLILWGIGYLLERKFSLGRKAGPEGR